MAEVGRRQTQPAGLSRTGQIALRWKSTGNTTAVDNKFLNCLDSWSQWLWKPYASFWWAHAKSENTALNLFEKEEPSALFVVIWQTLHAWLFCWLNHSTHQAEGCIQHFNIHLAWKFVNEQPEILMTDAWILKEVIISFSDTLVIDSFHSVVVHMKTPTQ